MSDWQKILCLLQHAPVEAEFDSSAVREDNDTGGSAKLPGWDDSLGNNGVATSLNGGTGQIRGRAFGISNPFRNFVSSVGARFTFRFFVRPDQVTAGELHRFVIDLRTNGRFLHFAAVPFPDDDRQPPAATNSVLLTQIEIFEISAPTGQPSPLTTVSEGGIVLKVDDEFVESNQGNLQDLATILPANNALTEVVSHSQTLAMNFRPTGNNGILCRVRRFVTGSACGEFSDIRIRGSQGRRRFRVIAENPRVQKVLRPGDACFDVLNP